MAWPVALFGGPRREISNCLAPISWNPDVIEQGTNELIKSIRSLSGSNTKAAKIAGEKLYIKIKKIIWHKHWNYYWGK